MSDLRKAAEQALEAYEHLIPTLPGLKDSGSRWLREELVKATDALRAALAEPEQSEPVADKLGGEWVPCVKLPITVHVRNQRADEKHISTREGITPVRSDDLIMRGVAGEEYPIGRELFERTYRIGAAPPRRGPDERDTVLRQALEALESQKAYIEANEPGLVTDVPAIAAIKEILND